MRQLEMAKTKAKLSLQRQQVASAMRLALARNGAHPAINADVYAQQGSYWGGGNNGRQGQQQVRRFGWHTRLRVPAVRRDMYVNRMAKGRCRVCTA